MQITRRQLRKLITEAIFVHGSTIPDRLGLSLPPDTSNIQYTALVLDQTSQQALLRYVPAGWTPICHHVTLISPPNQKFKRYPEYYLNQPASVVISSIIGDDKVVAGVVDINSSDMLPYDGPKFLHVTIATNPSTNGKAMMSNDLNPIGGMPVNIPLTGIIQEITKK